MPKNSNKESREMTTNLEQVCPNDPSHKLSPGTLLCMTCGVPPVPVGGVAAKPEHIHTQECWSGFADCDPPTPAPADPPDELEREIEGLIALWENQGRTDEEKWAVRNFFTGAGLMIPKIVDRIVARKEATAARQARADLGQKAAFGGKANVYGQVIHLAGQGHTGAWIGSWAQRQLDRLAALTKGETK